ncbi:MAG: hypothetical protein HYT67_01730 [Candidatus Yanofskybacteria bacterium]|nr:hypothetical protein [Candidatus Yanofskybacteria bacterium]
MLLGIKGWELFGYAEIAASLELAYYGWFFWWLGSLIKNNPKLKEFYDDAKAKGVDKVLRKLVKISVELLLKESKNKRLDNAKNGNPKRESFFTMFLLGGGIGTWILGLLIFHATKSYVGLAGLFLGNAVKIACFVLLANLVGFWGYLLVTLVALFKAYRFVFDRIKDKLSNIAMSL